MDDPIKIIHKYKNNNGRIQYGIYIFIGDIFEESFKRLLKKVKDMDLYTALVSIDIKERDAFIKHYGDFWYEKLFNSHHIKFVKQTILDNTNKSNDIKKIYGTEWFNIHFVNYKKRYQVATYSYESIVKEGLDRKMSKKNMFNLQTDEELIDYTTQKPLDIAQSRTQPYHLSVNNPIIEEFLAESCNDEDEINTDTQTEADTDTDLETEIDSEEENGFETDSSDDIIEYEESEFEEEMERPDTSEESRIPKRGFAIDRYNLKGGDIDEDDNVDLDIDQDMDDEEYDKLTPEEQLDKFENDVEKDIGSIEEIFSNLEDTDKNIKETTKEIKKAITSEVYDNIVKKILEFDQSKDNIMFDENLRDVYTKNYVTQQYIYKDDTIRNIRNKICCGFKNNSKFGKDTYIIPSYQYLWSEYQIGNTIEKVMIGQKWIIRHDILKLDIEPNNRLNTYQDLHGNLKLLKDNIRRQGKVKREDDEYSILLDYNDYFTNNEIFMIDIYNELGMDYDPTLDELKNLLDVYVKIYFPRIRIEEMKNIIDFLQKSVPESQKTIERETLKTIYETINNDLILENKVMEDVELVKLKHNKDYTKIFKESYVIQSMVRVYLHNPTSKKLDLFRIFDNFLVNTEYPFVQFQPVDGIPTWKYSETDILNSERKEIVMKWFENAPYGISFKVKTAEIKRRMNKMAEKTSENEFDENDKLIDSYMAINLNESGRIDYHIQWKESDALTINDIDNTYKYVKKLLNKINKENEEFGIKLNVPKDSEFKTAFINTIQRIDFPEKFSIDHDQLSEFSRYFYPYIALVIDPKKRKSKYTKTEEEKSKFGTYLRFKRVTGYENKTKIEHRIIFFMRNYEYDDRILSDEIAKEFNITEEQAMKEITNVREKYPNIKKSRRVLKKFENIPKYKPPGINIDIQGKLRTNYKMRIAGARDRGQLNRINKFMNILIYLYIETYLYKRPERQKMKENLKLLTKIAKRRNKVDTIVKYEQEAKTVKQMISIDKRRLGYKPEENQNQWTRDCQNSGTERRRQPQLFQSVDTLKDIGYEWNSSTGFYERKINVTEGDKKKKQTTLRAVKLPLDEIGENFVYYTCSPEDNGKYIYIGFLGRSNNPSGEAMPCCFIKDHYNSKNKKKRDIFLKSVGMKSKESENEESVEKEISGDKLYILQDTNKILEGRMGDLPQYLDIFMNYMMGNVKNTKNHYLIDTKGYYFKYGTKQDEQKYLNAIGALFGMTDIQIKNCMIKRLEDDKNNNIFTSLNNGDIRMQFNKREDYIDYIKKADITDYSIINDLLTLPRVITQNGINILIFQKKIKVIRKLLEKEKIKENYYIVCQNPENISQITDSNRDSVFIIKENRSFYPIILVKKENPTEKTFDIIKTFKYSENDKNIIKHIYEYYKLNCKSSYNVLFQNGDFDMQTAKEINTQIKSIKGAEHFIPKYQLIDARYKCRYLVSGSGHIIPVTPSGSIYNINMISNLDKYLSTYDETHKYLIELNNLTKGKLHMKPVGIYYIDKYADGYVVNAIIVDNYDSVPIKQEKISLERVKKDRLIVQNKPNDDLIDKEIQKGKKSIIADDRIISVNKDIYEVELYQLFRYHLSYFLIKTETGKKYAQKIESIISDKKIPKRERRIAIKRIMYQMSNKDLEKVFNDLVKKKNLLEQNGGMIEDYWINIMPDNKQIDYANYKIDNNRKLCYIVKDKDSCENNKNCSWNGNKNQCALIVKKEMLVNYINKVTEEFIENDFKAQEIFQKNDYYVSNIVNYNIFKEVEGTKIIKSSNTNIGTVFTDIFGQKIPKVGRQKREIDMQISYEQLSADNPLKELSEWYVRSIIANNYSLFRAFSNAHYWIIHPYSEISHKDIGYYSNIQTKLSNGYKAEVVKWLTSVDNTVEIEKKLSKYVDLKKIYDTVIKINTLPNFMTNCIGELYILSKIYDSLIIIHDENFIIIYVIHPKQGVVYDTDVNKGEFNKSQFNNLKKIIHLRFIYEGKMVPERIEVLYPK